MVECSQCGRYNAAKVNWNIKPLHVGDEVLILYHLTHTAPDGTVTGYFLEGLTGWVAAYRFKDRAIYEVIVPERGTFLIPAYRLKKTCTSPRSSTVTDESISDPYASSIHPMQDPYKGSSVKRYAPLSRQWEGVFEVCIDCGAMVGQRDTHDQYHSNQDQTVRHINLMVKLINDNNKRLLEWITRNSRKEESKTT